MSLHATTIFRDFRCGSSFPMLVEANDGARYIIKWTQTGEGPAAPAVDLIALRLAEILGIAVPRTSLISVTKNLADQVNHGELRDLIHRSAGINLAIEYLPHARLYTAHDRTTIDEAVRKNIFALDLLLLNIDRTDLNPNMLFAGETLYCIDFSSSMALKELLGGARVPEQALLPLLRRHPFYMEGISYPEFHVPTDRIRETVNSVPDAWLADTGGSSDAIRRRAQEGIAAMAAGAPTILAERLRALTSIPFESLDEIRARQLKNRQEFEGKFGKF